MFNIDRKVISHFDYATVIITLPIVALSISLIFEVNDNFMWRQMLYIGFTMLVSAVIFILPLRKLLWIIPLFYWGSIALLLSVEIFGVQKFGAQRWLEVPFVGMSIQPSEIMKLALILMLAYNIANNPPPRDGYGLKDFLKYSFLILLPTILVKIQPDLGTAILIFVFGFGVLFIVGIHKKILLASLCFFAISLPIMFFSLKDYQLERIESFISADAKYQVQQSMIAIGSGGLLGKDLDNATQAQLKFLPVPESDFIFAYFCERYGFLGGFALIVLYLLLILHLFSISYEHRKDKILQVVSTALAFLIFIHFSVNVLMVMKFAPVVGIPLPFFSYGGSSFLSFGILFAILENLLAFKYHFKV